ncbi:MAG: malonyl-CoA decarboxylase [Alphaproteobacteria bacterium]|nr:malonyl-CoA decarboxylase [Alphaproteobacteria bacterium]
MPNTAPQPAPLPPQEKSSALSLLTGRAVDNLLRTWQEVKSTTRSAIGSKTLRPHLPEEDIAYLNKQIKACLEPKGGEVTARINTVQLGKLYLQLNAQGRSRFFKLLAEEYDINHEALVKRAEALVKAESPEERRKAERALRDALVAPRVTLFRQFNTLPNGFKFLVDMRSEMLASASAEPLIATVEDDLKQMLSAWFDIGLLDTEEITWKSPAELLEKLMVYEAVHPIRSWDDLKNRLDADRRVFGFFHNKMPLEPLIFVQVAFTKGLATSIQELLDETKPVQDLTTADTAIFYSISNAQSGLAGISFGNFLIKRVVNTLTAENKNIKQFATLSPIPGFRKWLDETLKKHEDAKLLIGTEASDVKALGEKGKTASEILAALLAAEWHKNDKVASVLKPVLTRLVAHYLTQEKRRGKQALDPVAHFHLSNGARLEQINWLGDTSPKGFKQSAGLMVNYHYILGDIDHNHEDYVTDGTIATSKTIQSILKG